ncbi:hypothetical protein [Acidovorax anthurii]|uniref:hypothetical protein n=1 Tax=Paracidovorax anthurii TaxID=78229 RepID=UPI000DD0C03B
MLGMLHTALIDKGLADGEPVAVESIEHVGDLVSAGDVQAQVQDLAHDPFGLASALVRRVPRTKLE